MFYPVDSLRRGGRFYLLWVADSWPHRFASISRRQLWSQDIRKLCDELKDVMISESGRRTHRYSLRLSSQLMRGLVRLYQKKVSVLLGDLCMIHANVIRHSNKRYNIQDVTEQGGDRPQPRALEPKRRTTLQVVEAENDQRIEELLQNSSNVVANIQDITLREAVIADPILHPTVGFGEENAEQALQFLRGRSSVEQMMAPSEAAVQHSALELPAFDTTELLDKSRLPLDNQMERISGPNLTMMRPSDGGLLSVTDFGKEIPDITDIPDIPIPIPEIPEPQEKPQQEPAAEIAEVPIEHPREELPQVRDRDTARESTQIELEDLEEIEPRAKRRRKLIIDKKIQISSDVLRARIQNPRVELRYEDSSNAIIDFKVPFELYMNRPCHAGIKERHNIALALTRLFMRNLGVINRNTAHREIEEEEMQRPQRYRTRSHLEQIPEVVEPTVQPEPIEAQETSALLELNLAPPEIEISNVNVSNQPDIADMVTQKLDTLSQQKPSEKRVSDEATPTPKRQKSVGYVSHKENQQKLRKSKDATAVAEAVELAELDIEVHKENIPTNEQTPARVTRTGGQRSITSMLHEAGLSDLPDQAPLDIEPTAKQYRTRASESSESLLGSLDRTKVSLGDSDTTTDSKRFIRDQWGAEGTMYKIVKCIRNRRRGESITIRNLVARGPIIEQLKNIITAKCFSSVLKLKQHGFITIRKCPNTLEILDIMLGPNFPSGSCI